MSKYLVDLAAGTVSEEIETTEESPSGLGAWLDSLGTGPRQGRETPESAPAFFGPEDLVRLAHEGDLPLPPGVAEDAALKDELREQSEREHFGPAEGDGLSDDEAWANYRGVIGEES